ncbi:hypothetical protein XocBAI20_13735 [Xanthomonas oryzae pv. oryzicola]|nr:hypothetical protein XocBAI20_13735 [Xanthomonas oryzae pv. oryzicola]
MICSSEKRFFTSNLLGVGNWTPNRCATQTRGDVGHNRRRDFRHSTQLTQKCRSHSTLRRIIINKSNRWYFDTKACTGMDEIGAVSASGIYRSHVADVKVTQENTREVLNNSPRSCDNRTEATGR